MLLTAPPPPRCPAAAKDPFFDVGPCDKKPAEACLAAGDALYGVVLLSDGQDTNSHSMLAELEQRLQPREGDARGIQVHTIAIG